MDFTPRNFKEMMTLVILCLLVLTSTAIGSSLDKAKMFRQHGLVSEAKKELIEVIFSEQDAIDKAEAYYTLGTLAFEQNNIAVALETWSRLIADFPGSDQAKLVKGRINQLSEIVGEKSRTVIENAIAQSYLRHADFWSEDVRHKKFIISSSSISGVEVAISWYDKVIQEFPKTEASRLAYEEKMLTLIGKMQSSIEAKRNMLKGLRYMTPNIMLEMLTEKHQDILSTYMPSLLETFSMFERDHPKASSLQAFRYQIAQRYWIHDDLNASRVWLNLIIEQSREHHTFYRDLAERRLKRLE